MAAWTEVELRPGHRAPVEEIEQRLLEAGLRPAEPAADAELDRLLRPAPRPRRAGRRGSAGAALVEYLATHADRLAAEELRVRRGEPDSVHQLRVASRRLRSALQAFRPLLDRAPHRPDRRGPARVRPGAGPGPGRRGAQRADQRRARRARAGAAARPGPGPGHPALRAGRVGGRRGRAQHAGRGALRPAARRARGAADPPAADQEGEGGRDHGAAQAGGPDRAPAAARGRHRHRPRAGRRAARPRRARRPQGRASGCATPPRWRARWSGRTPSGSRRRSRGSRPRSASTRTRWWPGRRCASWGPRRTRRGRTASASGVLHAQDAALAARIEEQLPALWADAWTPRNRRWLR